jgi:hypothetical protein
LAVAFRRQRRFIRASGWYVRSYRADPQLFRIRFARTVRAAVGARGERRVGKVGRVRTG